jgi:hypothetical protein
MPRVLSHVQTAPLRGNLSAAPYGATASIGRRESQTPSGRPTASPSHGLSG